MPYTDRTGTVEHVNDTYSTAEIAAAVLYRARREKQLWPQGERRNAGWFPTGSEFRPCCSSIQYPKVFNPNVKLHHCCSAGHVAAVCGADATNVRRLARHMDGARLPISGRQSQLVLELRKSANDTRYETDAALELVGLWHEDTTWATITRLDSHLRQLAWQFVCGGMRRNEALAAIGALGA